MKTTTPEEWLKQGQAVRTRAGFNDVTFESGNGTVSTAWSGAADYSGPIDDREPVADSFPSGATAIADALNAVPVMERALIDVLAFADELDAEHPDQAQAIRDRLSASLADKPERVLPVEE